ncbi:MAG: TRAP transporter small permease [Firmicutes bacterium]|nr:TRAP transporter small permease [Bacillota bacterium]
MLRALNNAIDRILTYLCSICLITIVVVFLIEVLFRYILKISFAWSLEVNRIAFIWMCLMGAAMSLRKRGHIRFEIIIGRLKSRPEVLMSLFCDVLALAFFLFLLKEGYTVYNLARMTKFPTLRISQGWMFAALPLSAVVMLIYTIELVLNDVAKLTAPTREGHEAI